jgi:hypothetical protein
MDQDQQRPPPPLFLHIPVWRLVVMSIISGSLYDLYWMYKNWQYIKQREGTRIWPFWRGVFGVLFCHSLLRRIHENEQARSVRLPTFSPWWLATGWIALNLVAKRLGALEGVAGLAGPLLPTCVCLLPVQSYVNAVEAQRRPGQPFYRWSAGHIACLIVGALFWSLVLHVTFGKPGS